MNNRVFTKTVVSPQAMYILNGTFILRLGRQVSDRCDGTSCSSCSCCYQFSKCTTALCCAVTHTFNSTFRKLWRQLVPNIAITKPCSDICWECHQNNTAIYRSANLPDAVKGAKLRKQEEHLCTVTNEHQAYQQMVTESKNNVADCRLGRNDPRSRDTAVHYSFDYAQQVHYPSDPLQPGPMYFLCPRKCLL